MTKYELPANVIGRGDMPGDYKQGSSDYPVSGHSTHFLGQARGLDARISQLDVQFRRPDNSIDVERTNEHRLNLIRERGLRPVVVDRKTPYYRTITRDTNGLLEVSYRLTMPDNLEALFDDEKIPIGVATQYLGIEKEEMNRMLREREIRRTGNTYKNGSVRLKDVNELKGL